MSILSATTSVSSQKSASEIQALLGAKDASSVSIMYENGEASSVYFAIEVNKQFVNFKLPCNWQGVLKAMHKDKKIPWRLKDDAQAKRVAGRIILTWVKAQLALIEAGQAEMAEVFMPYAVTGSGSTLFERLSQNPQLLLDR